MIVKPMDSFIALVRAVCCWAAVSPAVMLDKTQTRHDEVNINPLVYKLHNVAIRRHLDTKIALFVILMRTRVITSHKQSPN